MRVRYIALARYPCIVRRYAADSQDAAASRYHHEQCCAHCGHFNAVVHSRLLLCILRDYLIPEDLRPRHRTHVRSGHRACLDQYCAKLFIFQANLFFFIHLPRVYLVLFLDSVSPRERGEMVTVLLCKFISLHIIQHKLRSNSLVYPRIQTT